MSKKIALITGGLGRKFVRIHAEKGGELVLVGRTPQKLAQLQQDVLNKSLDPNSVHYKNLSYN